MWSIIYIRYVPKYPFSTRLWYVPTILVRIPLFIPLLGSSEPRQHPSLSTCSFKGKGKCHPIISLLSRDSGLLETARKSIQIHFSPGWPGNSQCVVTAHKEALKQVPIKTTTLDLGCWGCHEVSLLFRGINNKLLHPFHMFPYNRLSGLILLSLHTWHFVAMLFHNEGKLLTDLSRFYLAEAFICQIMALICQSAFKFRGWFMWNELVN